MLGRNALLASWLAGARVRMLAVDLPQLDRVISFKRVFAAHKTFRFGRAATGIRGRCHRARRCLQLVDALRLLKFVRRRLDRRGLSLKLFAFNVGENFAGVALEGVRGVDLRLACMALATEGHVHVFAADHGLAVFAGGAESEAGTLFAQFADGRQLLDLLALRNQLDDLREGAAQESALQRRNNHHFPVAGRPLGKLNNVIEELALVNANNVVGAPLVTQVCKQRDGHGSLLLAGVGADCEVCAVALVRLEFDSEDAFARNFMLVAAAEQLGGFSSEHATHDQLDATSLSLLGWQSEP